jgi:hypothetical protein
MILSENAIGKYRVDVSCRLPLPDRDWTGADDQRGVAFWNAVCLAEGHAKAGSPEDALYAESILESLHELEPNDPYAAIGLAFVRLQKGELTRDAAEQLLARFVDHHVPSVRRAARLNLASSLIDSYDAPAICRTEALLQEEHFETDAGPISILQQSLAYQMRRYVTIHALHESRWAVPADVLWGVAFGSREFGLMPELFEAGGRSAVGEIRAWYRINAGIVEELCAIALRRKNNENYKDYARSAIELYRGAADDDRMMYAASQTNVGRVHLEVLREDSEAIKSLLSGVEAGYTYANVVIGESIGQPAL